MLIENPAIFGLPFISILPGNPDEGILKRSSLQFVNQ
jgi:hypothetical protein